MGTFLVLDVLFAFILYMYIVCARKIFRRCDDKNTMDLGVPGWFG